MKITLPALGLLLALPSAAQAQVSLFLGPPGGVGDVVVAQEGGFFAGPLELLPDLSGIALLPLDVSGRTQLEMFLPGRARLRMDVAGAARLQLPAEQGSLYHYRRDQPDGSANFGWMLVGADGRARRLAEFPGSGPLGADESLFTTVAFDADASHLLFATLPAAGGDLFELELSSGLLENRSSTLPALNLSPEGLRLLPAWGAVSGPEGVWRFLRQPGAQLESLALAANYYSGSLASSEDGQRVVTAAGASLVAQDLFVFGSNGGYVVPNPAPMQISAAGYLPTYLAGPFLVLNEDGTQVGWREEGAVSDAWLARVDPLPGWVPSELSADANFADTFDQVGVFCFRPGGGLLFGVGEKADPVLGGIEQMDYYEAQLGPAASVSFSNLTLTSGDPSVPFLVKAQLDPNTLLRLPGGERFVIEDSQSNSGALLLLDLSTNGFQTLIPGVKSLDLVELGGNALAFGVHRSVALKQEELWRLPLGPSGAASAPSIIAQLPDGTLLSRPSMRPDGWLGLVVSAGSEWIASVHAPSGATALLSPIPFAFGSALGRSAGGKLTLSAGAPGGPAFFLGWQPGEALDVYPAPTLPGQVLPGR